MYSAIEILKSNGNELKFSANTNNGEYKGPCPMCGGTDRFCFWPNHPEYSHQGGKYWCRRCNKGGSAVELLERALHVSRLKAQTMLAVDPLAKPSVFAQPYQGWSPTPVVPPSEQWQRKALVFVKRWNGVVKLKAGEQFKCRGINLATINRHWLGFNAADQYEEYEDWGLAPEKKDNGMYRKLWLPSGLVIPYFGGCDLPQKLKIRCLEPREGFSKYLVIKGSASCTSIYNKGDAAVRPVVVVEGEFDGLLLEQEAGDLVVAMSMGSAQAKPDCQAYELLKSAPLILVAFDSDQAGDTACNWWLRHFGNKARRLAVPSCKDPGEYFLAGGDLRAWVAVGINTVQPRQVQTAPVTQPAPAPAAPAPQPLPPVVAEAPAPPTAQQLLHRLNIAIDYVTDNDRAREVVNRLLASKETMGVDLETAKLPEFAEHDAAGLDPHMSRIRLAQFYPGNDLVHIFDLDKVDLSLLVALWDCSLVAHNAVFELKHLIHAGEEPAPIHCTMLQANVLRGDLPSLAVLAEEYLDWSISKELQVSDWAAETLSQAQLAYAALDAVAALRLHKVLYDKVERYGLERPYLLMRDAQKAVARMELNGLFFDKEAQARLMLQWRAELARATAEVTALLGPKVNLNSGVQLSEWIKAHASEEALATWPRTDTGQLRTNEEAFALHSDLGFVAPLLAYKRYAKLLSTNGDTFAECISPASRRIHASFRLGGTATGRLSCWKPNVQNPPRAAGFRELFVAPEGRKLVVADYSQIELRVAALVSHDPVMLEAYANGDDLHSKTAEVVSGQKLSELSPAERKELRQKAKAVNFGLLYGQGAPGLARYAKANYGVAMTEAEAAQAKAAFLRSYPGMARWQRESSAEAKRIGKVTTPGGRVRDFRVSGGGYSYTESLNTPIQGGAAEVMLNALIRLDRYLPRLDAMLVNVVHDEVIVEVAEEQAEEAKDLVEQAMIEGMLEMFPDASTRGLVEAHIGSNWAEAK